MGIGSKFEAIRSNTWKGNDGSRPPYILLVEEAMFDGSVNYTAEASLIATWLKRIFCQLTIDELKKLL